MKHSLERSRFYLWVVHHFNCQMHILCSSLNFLYGFIDCVSRSYCFFLLFISLLCNRNVCDFFNGGGSIHRMSQLEFWRVLAFSSKSLDKSRSFDIAISWKAFMKLEARGTLTSVSVSYTKINWFSNGSSLSCSQCCYICLAITLREVNASWTSSTLQSSSCPISSAGS